MRHGRGRSSSVGTGCASRSDCRHRRQDRSRARKARNCSRCTWGVQTAGLVTPAAESPKTNVVIAMRRSSKLPRVQPRVSGQSDNTQCENQAINSRSQKRHQCDGEENPRKRHQGINNDHRYEGVYVPTNVPGESSDEYAKYPGEQNYRRPHPHTDAGPQQDAGKDITAQLIVTKRMVP